MTADVLVSGLRWFFWGLVYVGLLLVASMLFAGVGPLKWVALVAIVFVIADDVRRKRGRVAS